MSKILAAKKPEAKGEDKRKKLLSSMISVKGRERYTPVLNLPLVLAEYAPEREYIGRIYARMR